MRRMAAVSVALHTVLLFVPWWKEMEAPGGGGGEGGPGDEVFAVAFFEPPAATESPVPAALNQPAFPDGLVDPEPLPQVRSAAEVSPFEAEPEPWRPPPPEPPSPVEPSPPVDPEPDPPAEAPDAGPGRGQGTGRGDGDLAGEGTGEGRAPAAKVPSFRPPKLLTGVLPLTPEEAEDLDLPEELEIDTRLHVGTDGRVIEAVPEDPDLPAPLVAAIERAARSMRFRPALERGTPVPAWFPMRFTYRR